MTFILNPESIAEAKRLGLPSALLARWNQCIQNDDPMSWRALSTWMRAEAGMCEIYYMFASARLIKTLEDVAHRHYLELMPRELEIAA